MAAVISSSTMSTPSQERSNALHSNRQRHSVSPQPRIRQPLIKPPIVSPLSSSTRSMRQQLLQQQQHLHYHQRPSALSSTPSTSSIGSSSLPLSRSHSGSASPPTSPKPLLSALRSSRYAADDTRSRSTSPSRRITVSTKDDFRRSPSHARLDGLAPRTSSRTSLQEVSSNDLISSQPPDTPTKSKDPPREVPSSPIRIVEVTEYHKYIQAKEWRKLEKVLKKFNGRHYKRMQERAERQRSEKTTSKQSKVDPSGPTTTEQSDPEKLILSPLLKVDDEGRTPLHLAYLNACPGNILLMLQDLEPTAAKQPDNQLQLPLHLAMIHTWASQLMEQLIQIHPNALKSKDLQGRTPLGYSVELAMKGKDETFADTKSTRKFHWGSKAIDEEEQAWQYEQTKRWNKTDFLLSYLMRRKKHVLPSEHGLLVEAIEAGAPSKVIHRFISTTNRYLTQDDDSAGNALAMCVERQYTVDTLEYLIEYCRQGTTVIQDYTEKALITHYRRGCQPIAPDLPSFGKEIIDWCKARPDGYSMGDEDETMVGFLQGASTLCREWWEMLRYLLFFAAFGKDLSSNDTGIKKIHMLHAALSIASTQPSLIQLLLVIFPEARNELCPVRKVLPVHLMCTTWRYDVLRNDKDASMEKVIKMFLKAHREQVVRRVTGRLPLHLALMMGQSWSFVKFFIHFDKLALGMRDPHSNLFPFQLAALCPSSKNIPMMIRQRYTPTEWKNTHPSQKQMEFDIAKEQLAQRQIGTVYELLRHHPGAIAGRVLSRNLTKPSHEIHNAGQISMHYFNLVYRLDVNGWRVNPSSFAVLRNSIMSGSVPNSLARWWSQLKIFIWKTTPSDSIPSEDEYLLHAALYNPDTPPIVIELLLAVFPGAASRPIPRTRILPLHIASGTVSYLPQKFELPHSSSSLELTLKAYKKATRARVNRQLAIHMAISQGKTWKQIEPLVKQDRKSLSVRDPVSRMTPIEHMACSYRITSFNSMFRYARMFDNEARGIDLDGLPVGERARILREIKRKFDLEVLSTIYELLRRAPSALSAIPTAKDTMSSPSDSSIFPETGPVEAASDYVSEEVNEAVESELMMLVGEGPVLGPRRGASLFSYLNDTNETTERNGMPFDGDGPVLLPRRGLSLTSYLESTSSHATSVLQGGVGSSCRSLESKTGSTRLFCDYSPTI